MVLLLELIVLLLMTINGPVDFAKKKKKNLWEETHDHKE
jgi:hypothetical protein